MGIFSTEATFDRLMKPYHMHADRIMNGMNIFLLLLCLGIAPLRDTYISVLLVGLPTLLLSIWLTKHHSGELSTRIFMGVAFMAYTGLIIHQTGGDIEAHFSAFGLIGVLLYYRDWRPIIAATVAIYLHHLVLGYAQTLGVLIFVFDDDQFWSLFGLHVAYFLPFIAMMVYLSVWLRREGYGNQHVIDIAQQVLKGDLLNEPVSEEEKSMPLVSSVILMKNRLLELLKIIPVATAVVRVDTGSVMSSNEAWMNMIGTIDSDIHFGDAHFWVEKEHWGTLMMNLKKSPNKILKKNAIELKHADGSPFEGEISIILHEGVTPVMAIMTIEDITEKNALEKQLRQSQKMEAVGVLVGGIAHEFNNMLAGITGNLYLAKKKAGDNPDVIARLDTVDRLSFKAANMIKQLLVFAGKDFTANNVIPINMAQWLPERVNLAHAELTSNAQLKCIIEKSNHPIIADPTELQQILKNLFNNALEASSYREHPQIEVALSDGVVTPEFRQMHKDFQGQDYVRLIVRDNGVGIPNENLDRIFEPFYTTKEVGKGTGLGMSVIEGVVKSMHGSIEVESAVDVGTTFNIYFPRLQHNEIKTEGAKVLKNMANELQQGNGKTILIADDEPEVLNMLSEILQDSLGYKVISVRNGQEAFEKFQGNSQSIDMALLDVVMPKLSGLSAAKLMREINPNIPVVFLTGYNPDQVQSDLDELDNYSLISKPIRVDELSMILKGNQ